MQFRIALWGVVIDHNFDRGHRANFRIAISDRCPASLRAIDKIKISMKIRFFGAIQSRQGPTIVTVSFAFRLVVVLGAFLGWV